MSRKVIFRDYQEQTAGDHNNLQAYVQEAIDSLVKDGLSASRRYSGLTVSKTGQVEVTVGVGSVYDGGKVYDRRTSFTQSMSTHTAAAARRLVVVSAYGQEVETDATSRDFLVDAETGATEPRSVAMTLSRDVQLVFTPGSEAADPVPPAIPATHVVVAHILMDTTQVLSISMIETNRITSTDQLDARTDLLEAFRSAIEPRVASLASDLADLANQLAATTSRVAMARIFEDLARVKEALRFPASASGYGADFYLRTAESDTNNSAALGYDAKVEMGVRFADANANEFEISLFSANDPNAANVGGTLLPKYSDELKISTGTFSSEIGIAQYGFQTHTMKQGYMSRTRLRYGGSYTACSNGVNYNVPGQPNDLVGLYDVTSTSFDAVSNINYDPNNWAHESYWRNTYWLDTWNEPFLYAVTQDHSISGAQIAQTVLVSNDMIATKLGFYVTAKGANEDIHIALCEVSSGVPDLDRTILKTVYPHASIANGWNRFAVQPTFLKKGKRYAVVIVSNANHKFGMANGQGYLAGTFFYSTDGIYYQGDLTKDLMLEVYGAKFAASQVAIEFAPISLDGGFRNVDILAEMWAPDSTQLVWEMRPNGTGEWLPLVNDNGAVLASAPPLAQFRARFVGTPDMQPMLRLTGSRVRASRPKTSFKHVSSLITVPALPATANNVTVKVLLENFDPTPNTHALSLRVGASSIAPASTVTKLKDAAAKRYERTYTFTVSGGVTQFRIIQDGTTNSALLTYHVAERIYYTS